LGALSGGNQQRFIVGRERLVAPQAIVAEQPTRGLDVRAAAHVWDSLREVASSGGVAVVHSADLDEVLAVATRVVVCVGGRVVEVEPAADPQDRTPYARALAGLVE
jgi:simple sugar transport system ATP-binding protein